MTQGRGYLVPSMKLVAQHFRVANLDGIDAFYRGVLGMNVFPCQDGSAAFGFGQDTCQVVFQRNDSLCAYRPTTTDVFWKIGITVYNLDLAVAYLRSCHIEVSDPSQFRDIGYMARMVDPTGFEIELLQQGFIGHERPVPAGHPFAAQATLAHLTFRASSTAAINAYLVGQHGMRLMSIQPVDTHGFSLWFYGFSDDALPNEDLKAVENRAWLWSRPYALIEVQQLPPGTDITHVPDDMAGFEAFEYVDASGRTIRASFHALLASL